MFATLSFLPNWPLTPNMVFWVGLTLLAAGLFAELFRKTWQFPRITSYSIVGLIAGSAGFGIIDHTLAAEARFLLEVALGLLSFELGSRLNLRWLRANPWLIATSLLEAALTFTAVTAVLQLFHISLMTATVIASIVVATSPAMVVQLKSELKSEGQVTERLLALTALNSMYAIVLFRLVSVVLHQVHYGNLFAALAEPLYLIVSSLIIAYSLARCCRRINMQDEHSFVTLIGLILLAIAITHMLGLSTALALLTAGVIFKNIDPRPKLWPTHFGTAGRVLTVILFAATLISFQWHDLALGALGALCLIVARLFAKLIPVLLFAKPGGICFKQGVALGLSLTPMSTFAYLSVDEVSRFYLNIDPVSHAIMLCAIAASQLFTPFLVYWGLSVTGERKQ